MTIDVVGAKMKSQTGRGQMQDAASSSTRAKGLAIIPDVAPPNVDARAGGWQTRQVDATPIATHPAMKGAAAQNRDRSVTKPARKT